MAEIASHVRHNTKIMLGVIKIMLGVWQGFRQGVQALGSGRHKMRKLFIKHLISDMYTNKHNTVFHYLLDTESIYCKFRTFCEHFIFTKLRKCKVLQK